MGCAGQSAISALSHSGFSSPGGHFLQELLPSEYAFEISAHEYHPMRTHFGVAPGSVTRANINLDPVNPPQELREDIVASELRDGFELLHGYTGDAVTHRPVPGVHLRLKESGASATSDVRGYFQLYVVAVSTANAQAPRISRRLIR